MKRILLPLLFLLSGCAATPSVKQQTAEIAACRHHFTTLNAAMDEAGVRDHGAILAPGFPYLRVDRFLALFTDELDTPTCFNAWVERLAQLDETARAYEVAALNAVDRKQLLDTSNRCRTTLIHAELASEENRHLLREQARLPDDYVTAWRVLGLHPITACS